MGLISICHGISSTCLIQSLLLNFFSYFRFLNKLKFKSLIILLAFIFGTDLYCTNRDSLLKIAYSPSSTDSVKFFIYYDMAWDYLYSDPDSAYTFSKQAFFHAKKSGSARIQTKILNLMGSYFQVKGDYVKAIDYYQKSLNLGEQKKIDEAVLVALGNIGAIYITIGQNKKGLEYQLKSLAIAEKLNNENNYI